MGETLNYWDAQQYGTKIDAIDGNDVYYYKDKFHVRIDEVSLEGKTVSGLKSQARKLKAKPTRVMRFDVHVLAYNTELDPFEAIGYSKQMVYRIDEEGKKQRIYSDNLYVHTPELEKKLRAILKRAEKLQKDIQKTLSKANAFP